MGFLQTAGDVSRQLGTMGGAGSLVGLGMTDDWGSRHEMRSPVVPTDRTFTIWGPITLGNLLLVAHQALPAYRRDPVLRRIGWPLALAYGGAGVWHRAFERKNLPMTIGLVGATTGAAALAYHRLPPPLAVSTREQWLVQVPVGMLFGWLTVATAAAVTEELLDPDLAGIDVDRTTLGVGTVAAVTAVAGAVTVGMDRTLAYPAAVAWGLGGIVASQMDERPAVAAAAAVGLAVLGLASAIAVGRRRRRSRQARWS